MKTKKVLVNDRMQKNYIYEITEPMGKNFDPEFRPDLNPKEMLELGVFGGLYFSDKPKEFPKNWFSKAKLSKDGKRHKELNYFGIDASQSLTVWKENRWIKRQDPRGWMQWYFRYYLGRRTMDDARQIKRWKAMTRHVAQITHKCRKGDFNLFAENNEVLILNVTK